MSGRDIADPQLLRLEGSKIPSRYCMFPIPGQVRAGTEKTLRIRFDMLPPQVFNQLAHRSQDLRKRSLENLKKSGRRI